MFGVDTGRLLGLGAAWAGNQNFSEFGCGSYVGVVDWVANPKSAVHFIWDHAEPNGQFDQLLRRHALQRRDGVAECTCNARPVECSGAMEVGRTGLRCCALVPWALSAQPSHHPSTVTKNAVPPPPTATRSSVCTLALRHTGPVDVTRRALCGGGTACLRVPRETSVVEGGRGGRLNGQARWRR